MCFGGLDVMFCWEGCEEEDGDAIKVQKAVSAME
jgi:hypothetical protein